MKPEGRSHGWRRQINVWLQSHRTTDGDYFLLRSCPVSNSHSLMPKTMPS